MRDAAPDPLAAALDRLIAQRGFDIHFQPLVAIDRAEIFAFEALTRAPADGPLHSPLVLFDTAARCGRLIELEQLIIRRAVERFKALGLPGQLFVNVTADTLLAAHGRVDHLAAEVRALGLATSRIVVELTETRPIDDLVQLGDSLQALRAQGFRIALDDLGEGFASLRRWMEMRPDFVKIDRHFIDGVAQDPLKQQFVRSIVEMAATSGGEVVAEGLEQEPDLEVLGRLGITICQGYLFARPSAAPRAQLGPQWSGRLAAAAQPHLLQNDLALPLEQGAITTAAQLARRVQTTTPAASCQDIIDLFHRDDQLLAVPVLDEHQRPLGLLRSLQVLKRSTERYFMDIFARRSCVELMDPQPLVFDVSTPLRAMSDAVASLDERLLTDGFIVTRDGAYFGSGRCSDLLKAVSDLQVHAARYANPLTLLPGNVPIDNHLDRLIEGGEAFLAAVWDIDHFKPFNDVYGYRVGDDIIRLAARVLTQAADPQHDFVGHIGGDDFVMVLRGADWEARLNRVCAGFDAAVRSFFSAEHLAAGGYETLNRQNQPTFHPLPTFSAGALLHQPGSFDSARALAAALAEPKRVAKGRAGGSRYFIDRRLHGTPHRLPTNTPSTHELAEVF
ncbi:bifunctional diguanylate cyclase/phosphodiesterase [Roseateles sp. BYS87W]|uniref:Bifunctional diguanylate cyclase/phosphodiesterase n=1 Tax=Pelomonas baiyunensis TaxID=3299026 RepID=A0ABW7GUV5_9BURK